VKFSQPRGGGATIPTIEDGGEKTFLKMQPFGSPLNVQNRERKILYHVLCHLILDFLQSHFIDFMSTPFARRFSGEIDLPLSKEWVFSFGQ
jgi:hypothetical protein